MSTVTSMERAAAAPAPQPAAPATPPPQWADAWRERLEAALRAVVGPVAGFALFVLVWQVVAMRIPEIPTPGVTWQAAVALFSDPFYDNGPNDKGIGWNLLASLQRVGIGFGLAALVGIPVGFAIGRYAPVRAMFSPIVSLLRPVSPLAWLPLGLLLFKAANPAAIWAIFICSIWPMIINTAVGVSRVPQDYLNVARVLNLSEWKVTTNVLLPAVLPYMLTGVRLSIGTAWLVIVAAEMLTGGTGIGFWLWDEWNNLKVEHIVIAIFVIGIVGLILETLLVALARRFTYTEE
ncbi:nitrate ABC transporter, permease protein [Achromobacter xylosoxidans]|uniref:nitrate ABC transporter permease n=1 Tax=Achromobacter TaxID=222 RepID=UPI0004229E58|nr:MULTISPECIES: nitrate ABC transporter permease [Achromobacter]OFL33370.1 nitrate ABC transporter, permease protein [Achromobacter xylosoxidans]OFS50420.1 nitrate ABC transporter, permease protein [Achromobacter xylosoxidans]CKI07159.1 Bicarbonate transport system permease protein CmpB [Achromobacter xylosoxidans]CUJ53414.1 Bicarbonate transport system permease protein CmpB [Achromobacter xylosoxidans]SQG77067.1 Bicarbonate transport system permease protein CmpB [Achromobacter xylosoxidans]